MNHTKYFALLMLLFVSCSNLPDGILNQKQMENVIYDTHLAESLMEEYSLNIRSKDDKRRLLANVYKTNNTTKAQFDSSLVYYSAHLTELMKIYDRVDKRVAEQSKIVAREVYLYEKSLLTPEGDSVDIWKATPDFILDPRLLTENRLYEVKCDTNFKDGDSLVLNMNINKMQPDSLSKIYLLFALKSTNDSISMIDTFLVNDGNVKLNMSFDKIPVAGGVVTNFTYIIENDSIVNPVYINDVSLMRYHRDIKVNSDSLITEISTNE
ncbi:MAG: DUF4296 domain-containing protein [Bacteroidales bacterium]|nr:DUF4296 domain-containing protein [Bacteroidales bacterium]